MTTKSNVLYLTAVITGARIDNLATFLFKILGYCFTTKHLFLSDVLISAHPA